MNIIDLSHFICADMPVYSKDESPSFEITSSLEKDGYMVSKYVIYSHTGTHIDAPTHMLDSNINLNSMDINRFAGKATILDYSVCKSKCISIDDIISYQERIAIVDFLIIKTGWSKNWKESYYHDNYPYLDNDTAEYLSSFNIKGVGIDTISVDRSDSKNFPVHKKLLSKNIVIIENLTNLDSVHKKYFLFCAFPLKIKNADASPARVVAIEGIL